MTVRIVTDSTADFSPAEAEALGITIVPLTVFFGDDAYLDNVELDNARFYEKLQDSKELPRTSQPSPALFQETYQRLIDEGADAIISAHLSSGLSGTYQSACTGRDLLPEESRKIPIEVIDSQTISAGIAMGLRHAAAKVKQGVEATEIITELKDQFARTRIIAILDTLEYVKRGGRIGTARALLGNMLSVKPIITLKEGTVVPLEQPRTRSKAYQRAAQIIAESGSLQEVAIAESNEEVGQQLADVLKGVYSGEIPRYKLGGSLGTHTGPGTVAVVSVNAKA